MAILLAGDIGGTKTSLRLVDSQLSQTSPIPLQTILDEATYPSQEFADLVPLVRQFLARSVRSPKIEKLVSQSRGQWFTIPPKSLI